MMKRIGSFVVLVWLALLPVLGYGQSLGPEPFVTRWQCQAGEVIEVPLVGDYAYTWDLASSLATPPVLTASVPEGGVLRIVVSTPGTYRLKAGGEGIRYIKFGKRMGASTYPVGSVKALECIESWGNVAWETMEHAFAYCDKMDISPLAGKPDLSRVTSMSYMFLLCRRMNAPLNHWDVSNVRYMVSLFDECNVFNQPLDQWRVDNVEHISSMFKACHKFDQNLNGWNVSNVTWAQYVFANCYQYNQPMNQWDVSRVISLAGMFRACHRFNQDLSDWRPLQAKIFTQMFEGCLAFNSDLNDWQMASAQNTSRMFRNCYAFNQDLSAWDVSQVDDMSEMFTNCLSFDQSLGAWTPRKLKYLGLRSCGMSVSNYGATLSAWVSKIGSLPMRDVEVDAGWIEYDAAGQSARQLLIDMRNWRIEGDRPAGAPDPKPFVTTWQGTAGGTVEVPLVGRYTYQWQRVDGTGPLLTETVEVRDNEVLPLPTVDAAHYRLTVTPQQVRYMRFRNMISKSVIGSHDALRVVEQFGDVMWESMYFAFAHCQYMTLGPLAGRPDLHLVREMTYAFYGCRLMNQPLNHWDVSRVVQMDAAFMNCHEFDQPLDQWDVSNVTNMSSMFAKCRKFNQDLSSWNVSKVKYMGAMFYQCWLFNQPLGSWDVSSVRYMNSMFEDCRVFNQPLASWDVSSVVSMRLMFSRCYSFNQPLDNWRVEKVETMERMFEECREFNGSLLNWDVSRVELMMHMFKECPKFNQPLDGWDVRNARDMEGMLRGCYRFDRSLASWSPRVVSRIGLEFSGMSVASYTATLAGWVSRLAELPNNVHVQADWLRYGAAGQVARSALIEKKGWHFHGDVQEGTPSGHPFVTTWRGNVGGTVRVPLVGRYNYSWRKLPDGAVHTSWVEVTPGNTLNLSTPERGTYELSVEPEGVRYLTFFDFEKQKIGTPELLLTVERWGDARWQSMRHTFYSCHNLRFGSNPGVPNLSAVRSMVSTFNGAIRFNSASIQDWDVSNVEDMLNLFQSAKAFNQPLDKWDVSRVRDLNLAFDGAIAFDQSLAAWTPSSAQGSISLGKSAMGYVNYESTLRSWVSKYKSLQRNVRVKARGLKYSPAAKSYREFLENERGWSFEGDLPEPPVTSITRLVPDKPVVKVVQGGTVRVQVGMVPADASPSNLTWKVGEERYARVDVDGTVHGLAVGSTELTVWSTQQPDVRLVYQLIVLDPSAVPPLAISFAHARYKLPLGGHLQMEGELVFEPANTTLRMVKWRKDASNAISLNANNGVVQALVKGESTISVESLTSDEQVDATCVVEVVDPPVSVHIKDAPSSLLVGDTHSFEAEVLPAGTLDAVQWSVSGAGASFKDNVLTVTQAGPIRVMVTHVSNSALTDAVDITVVANPEPIPLESLAFKKAQYVLNQGETLQLADELVLTPSYATHQAVRWIEDGSGVVVVTAAGLLTGQIVGESVVRVKSVAHPSVMAECRVRVRPRPLAVKIENAPTVLTVNGMHDFTARVVPSGALQEVEWSVEGAGASFSNGNRLSVTQTGIVMVKVTTVAKPAVSVTVSVQVVSVGALVGLEFAKSVYELRIGETVSLLDQVVYTPTDAVNKAVTWSKDASSAITMVSDGLVRADALGESTVTITSQENASLKAECVVRVLVQPTSVQIVNAPVKLRVNDMYQFLAQVEPNDASQEVAWKVEPGAGATFNGNLLSVTEAKIYTVTVSTLAEPVQTHSVLVEVEADEQTTPLSGITFAQAEYVLRPGASLSLLDEVVYDPLDATNRAVTWNHDGNESVMLSEYGVVTAQRVGRSQITATSVENPEMQASCWVRVEVLPSHVVITNAPATLSVNGTYRFEARVEPQGALQEVEWSVTGVGASFPNSDNELQVTQSGVVRVTVTSKAKPTLSASVDVNVVEVSGLISVSFAQSEYVLTKGESLDLAGELVFDPSDALDKSVTWSKDVSNAVQLGANGEVSANGVGHSKITVRSVAFPDVVATCVVRVRPQPERVVITNAPAKLVVNGTHHFEARVEPDNALQDVVWSVTGAGASLSSISVLSATELGTVTVTVTTVAKPERSVSVDVQVVAEADSPFAPLERMQFATREYRLTQGSMLALEGELHFTPAEGVNKSVKWSKDASTSVTLSSDGIVTGLAVGKSVITALSEDASGLVATCVVRVVPQPTGVTIVNAPAKLTVNGTHRFEARVAPDDALQDVVWSVSGSDASFVGNELTVRQVGRVTVTAMTVAKPEKSVSVNVDVEEDHSVVPLDSLTLAESVYVLSVGDTLPLAGDLVFHPQEATHKAVTWSKDGSESISLTSEGLVVAETAGTALVTVTSRAQPTVSVSCIVRVLPAPTGLTITNAPSVLKVNASHRFEARVEPSEALQEVEWTVSDGDASFAGNELTVGAAGSVTVTATTKAKPNKSVSILVNVEAESLLESLSFAKPEYVLTQGEVLSLAGEVVYGPAGVEHKGVVWSMSGDAVSLSAGGMVEALSAGEVTITATSRDKSTLEARCVVRVLAQPLAVVITNAPAELAVNGTHAFEARVEPEGALQDVEWSVEGAGASFANGGNVLQVTEAGTVRVTVSTVAKPVKRMTVEVAVKASEVERRVTGLSLDLSEVSLKVGATQQLSARVEPEDATNPKVHWTSSNDSVATVVDGLVTGVSDGEALITVRSDDGDFTRECVVRVSSNTNSVDASALAGVHAYPNPLGARVVVSGASEVASYVLVDGMGRVVLEGVHDGAAELHLDTDSLASGMYLLRLEDGVGGRRVLRLVRR